MQPRRLIVAVLGVVFALATSAALQSQSPATQPMPRYTAGSFVWRDLITPDPAAGRTFYGALFGWTFENADGVDPGYTIIRHEGRRIGGIVRLQRADSTVAQWLSYVVVDNVDAAVDAFKNSGGTIYRGPLNAKKDLRVAAVADAQGAPLGLTNRGPIEAEERPPGVNRFLWTEYVARDADAALKFYGDAIGFKNEVLETKANRAYYLLSTDRPKAGLFLSPWERETSAWLPYVRVADPAAMAARAEQLGGKVVLAPRPDIRNGSLAIILDPAGAPVALQKFPFESGATP
jgi:predicted enzyme related to lactoylglutathione lyase